MAALCASAPRPTGDLGAGLKRLEVSRPRSREPRVLKGHTYIDAGERMDPGNGTLGKPGPIPMVPGYSHVDSHLVPSMDRTSTSKVRRVDFGWLRASATRLDQIDLEAEDRDLIAKPFVISGPILLPRRPAGAPAALILLPRGGRPTRTAEPGVRGFR